MGPDQDKDKDKDLDKTDEPARPEGQERAGHSGQGAQSALKGMKLWERGRALLRGIGKPDKPSRGG